MALRDWALAFQRMNQRAPLLWIDMACLNQSNIQEALAVLPIHLSGVKRMVCLVGSSYLHRIWCCAEVYTCIVVMGMRPSRLVVLPLEEDPGVIHPSERVRRVRLQISRFDIRSAQATNPADLGPIVKAAEDFAGGDLDVFNEVCRNMLGKRLLDNASAAVLENEREFAQEAANMKQVGAEVKRISGMLEDDNFTSTVKLIREQLKKHTESTKFIIDPRTAQYMACASSVRCRMA